MKRTREWDADPGPSAKKIASEESRARLDDRLSRRVTPPSGGPSPGEIAHFSAPEARHEEPRGGNDGYHPSEAAHHPHTLPAIQHMQQHHPSSLPPIESSIPASNGAASGPSSAHSQPPKEEPIRSEQQLSHEPAARKMDVDENYDDDGDDEKKAGIVSKGSPHGSSTGNATGAAPGLQAKTEPAV